ncbi:recombinase family protein [Enterovirga aerilata]|uniref:Recombinase family protein n=1 Tax=Enterovirga aerilata TaxID=2730920 RepID=A0A849I8E1_9HYPH|nr:recombinase family protein [Enterovirga sp. DB1703]
MNARPTLRCAIYTRVSTEHGLDQDFNSLDNQREAAEAYIKSQAHEGWRLIRDRYDDGGFSGGSMERPALQQLLADIQARRIDVVVVYKVDRLTRSLADFAKLVELFDAHGVSFVSVTQAFNTTTSMGRLTLNVLLSFAQFEREVTGERIRDKIAASKKKGIWMGGVVPLGYGVKARALHIVDEHAELIRAIFSRYQQLGSVSALKSSLDRDGIVVPERQDGAGRLTGGKPFSRGHLYKILSNPIYVGRLTHKGWVHEGQHPAILDLATFEAVQAQLAANTRSHARQRLASDHLLTGRIRDEHGKTMTPTHARKGPKRYRYYVSQAALQGRDGPAITRVPAPEIEAAVIGALRSLIPAQRQPESDVALVQQHCKSIAVEPEGLILTRSDDQRIEIAWIPASSRKRREIILPPGADNNLRPMKPEDRTRILRAIARARFWMGELTSSTIGSTDAIANRESLTERSVRMTLSLAFLSPAIVKAIIDSRLPRGIGLRTLIDLPASWAEQERALGM